MPTSHTSNIINNKKKTLCVASIAKLTTCFESIQPNWLVSSNYGNGWKHSIVLLRFKTSSGCQPWIAFK
jgi:hypothetical protein